MNKNEKKQLIIASIILLIFVILIPIINYFNNKKSDQFLIFGDYLIYEKSHEGWKQVKEINDDILKQKYTVETKNNKYKDVSLSYASGTWYYMDEDYKNIDNKDIRVAYSNLKNILLAKFTREYAGETDIEILEEALPNDIKDIKSFLPATSKITIDIDNDGENEYIFTTTNASLSYTGEKEVSKMFMVKNNEIIEISNDESNEPYSIMEILDLDNNGKYEMIVNKGNIDLKLLNSCYQIYEFDNNQWKLKQDCQ